MQKNQYNIREDIVKKTKLFIFSFVFILFALFLGNQNINTNVKAATVNTSDSISVRGAQVRTTGSPGIRFVASIDSSYDTDNVTAYGISIAFGDVDASEIIIGGTVNGKSVLSAQVSSVTESNFYYINLIDIPESMYGQKVSARAYIVENGNTIYSSSKTTRSLGQVVVTLKNLGQTSDLIETVYTTISTKYKKSFVDSLGSVYFDNPLYETNHELLGKKFIEDWNALLGTNLDPETAFVLNRYSSPFSDYTKTASSDDYYSSPLRTFFKNTEMNAKWGWLLDYIETELTDGTGYGYVTAQIELVLKDISSWYPNKSDSSWYYGAHLITYIMSIFNAKSSSCGYGKYEFESSSSKAAKLGLISNYNKTVLSDLSNCDLVYIGSSQQLPTITEQTGYCGVYYYGTSQIDSASKFTVPSSDSILVVEYIDESEKEYTITYELNGGKWGYSSKTEYILDFLKDFYAFVNPEEDFNTFAYGDSSDSFLGTWSDYIAKYDTGTNKLLYNNDLTADNDAYFLNSSKYKLKWTSIGKWVYDMNGRFGGTSYYGGSMDFYRYIINDPQGYYTIYGENFYNYPSINDPTLFSYAISTSDITLPTPQSADFLGWYLTSDFSGNPVTVIKAGTSGNLVLYAKWASIEQYTITFNSDGGTEVDPIEVYSNGKVTLPTVTKDGYEFLGWYYNDTKVENTFNYTYDTDITLVAKWEKLYNVTFNSDGGTTVNSVTIKENETITLPTITKDGYTFLGWYYNGTKVDNTFTYSYTTDITLVARWKEIMYYTITFNSDGGTAVESITVQENTEVILPSDIEKDGWTFTGWYYNDERLDYTFTYTYTTDITLVAKYTEIVKYQLSFNSDGGTTVSSKTVKYYEIIDLPTITKDNYEFLGWYYNNVKVDDPFTYIYESDITLVAKWERIYTITYNSNGGTVVNSVKVKANETVTLPETTQEGYDFLGWYYNDTKLEDSFLFTYNTDITIIAKWSEIVTFEITFDSVGGTSVDPLTVEKGQTVTLPSITKSGYIFLGWYYDDTKLEDPFTYTYSESITVTAKWQKEVTLENLTYSGSKVTYRNSSTVVQIPTEYVQPDRQLRAAWVTSIAGNFTPSTNKSTMKNNLQAVLDLFDKYNLNCMIFHIRAMNDAYYKTKLAPINSSYGTYSSFETWDYLEWLIDECHKRDIEFHAWLNPYRIKSYGYASTATESTVSASYSSYPSNPASSAENILMTYRSDGTKGAILNPAKEAVQDYIVDVCLEVMENYNVDAIHFDDYFYAQMSSGVTVLTEPDQDDYEAYIKANPSCGYSKSDASDKKQWRRDNIDAFIYKLHTAMTEFNQANNRAVQLGIAPTGIYKNGNGVVTYDANGTAITTGSNTGGQEHYNSYLFCDTKNWIDNEWIDYIMPQSYWGFTHPSAGYADVMDWWNKVVAYKDVNLYSGMGIYMSTEGGNYSWGAQAYEMSNQVLYTTKLENVQGVSLYSFGSLKTIDASSSQVAYPGLQRLLNEYWTEKVATPSTAASKYLLN